MSTSATFVDIPDEVADRLKALRFRKEKTNAALICTVPSYACQNEKSIGKVDRNSLKVEIDEWLDDTTIEDIAEELPENQPRYVLLSYARSHSDGRVSYPLVFIYWIPTTVKPEMNMLYAGAKTQFVQKCEVGKTFDIRDLSELTEEWLQEKLAFFK